MWFLEAVHVGRSALSILVRREGLENELNSMVSVAYSSAVL